MLFLLLRLPLIVYYKITVTIYLKLNIPFSNQSGIALIISSAFQHNYSKQVGPVNMLNIIFSISGLCKF